MSTMIALDDRTKKKTSMSIPQENMTENRSDASEIDNTKNSVKCLTSVLAFSIIYGLSSTFTQIGSTYILSQITTLEKTFGLTSASSGLMVSANDIGFSVTILVASHFLQRYHMPRILAICIFMVGVGSLLMTVPHLVKPTTMPKSSLSDSSSRINTTSSVLCKPTSYQISSNASCDPDAHNSSAVTMDGNGWVWTFLFIAILIQGMAKSPRESLSKTYVDNNSERKKTGFYVGILSTFQLFGPFLGFTLGGLISSLPIDLQETTLTPYDSRWLGAWWLGFFIIGGCCILTSFPIYMFPKGKQHPEAQRKSNENENVLKGNQRSEAQDKTSENENEVRESLWSVAKDFPRSSVRIFKSTVYTLTVLGGITYIFAFITLGSFGPKYLEHQFSQPTYRANIILGGQNLVTTVIGTMLGGILALRMRLDMIGCCKLVILTRIVCIALTAFNYLFGCDNPDIIGYHDTSIGNGSLHLTCDCQGQGFLPVCVKDVGTFFSPCHAGCQAVTEQGYTNCSTSGEATVRSGICDTGCNYLIPFVVINALNALIGTVGIAPTYVIYLRSVEDRDRSLALGFASLLLSLLVLLPAPILIGNIFDSVCLVWRESCGVKGACTLYDLTQMRLWLVSIDSGLRVLSGCLAIFALVFACRQKKHEDRLNKRDEPSIQIQYTSTVHL